MSNTDTHETEAARLVRELRSGNGPLTRLTLEDITDIVLTFAPYGERARAEYFSRIRADVDRRHPTQYF
jgi:hypothetical protein